jgi:glycosyltransferase involved in cell wall biosynthesis
MHGDSFPMPPITALLHTSNDVLCLGRTLETLLPCAEILVVDHHSTDSTRRVARAYGARIIATDKHTATNHYLDLARHDWIFCLEPGESITEGLQASLFEWSALPNDGVVGGIGSHPAFSVLVREQVGERWLQFPAPETRLIPRDWTLWREHLPAPEPSAILIEGELLRFASLKGSDPSA